LPNPRYIVCYSGGHSSALVAIETVRQYGKDRVILLNHDIALVSEGQDIKRFKKQVADYLGMEITYCNARNWETKDQFDVVIEAGAFKVGNGTALCTNRMKTQPFENWLEDNGGPDDVICYGFDANEPKRIQRRSSHLASMGFKTDFPLALWKDRTIWATEDIGILRPNTYALFKHGNCVGCLKAGRQHWYVVYCTRPDVWGKGKMAEDEIGYSIIKGVYLEDLEPLFEKMRKLGIEPTEHIPAPTFWASVKKRIKLDFTEDSVEKPCECAA
jgi:hypothetical protein